MKLFYPDIYRDFYCIGSDCKDNCCKMGWDIEIDEDTYNFYKNLGDELSQKVAANIYEEDSCKYMGQQDGCPFLNEEGLCSLLLKYGEDKISDICREHPRFYQWFGDYKEAGVGICCEKSAEMLLEHNKAIEFFAEQTDEQTDDLEFDNDVFSVILELRNRLLNYMSSEEFLLEDVFGYMLESCKALQKTLDAGDLEGFLETAENLKEFNAEIIEYKKEDFKAMLENLSGHEFIHEDLPNLISYTVENFDAIYSSDLPKNYPFLFRNLAIYYTYRYLIFAVRNFELYENAKFVFESVASIYFLLLGRFRQTGTLKKDDYIFVIKEYSKEIEYAD